jgi:hypothetical protein
METSPTRSRSALARGGWSNDFLKAGALIRPAALGMIEGYLASGQDVVLPQMLTDPAEISLFEECAVRTNARFIERLLMDDRERSVVRFNRRGETDPDNPWHSQVQGIVANGTRRFERSSTAPSEL